MTLLSGIYCTWQTIAKLLCSVPSRFRSVLSRRRKSKITSKCTKTAGQFWRTLLNKPLNQPKYHIVNKVVFCSLLSSAYTSFSFGLFPIRGRHSRYLHFYDMAFVLQSDTLPAINPLFRGKTGPPVFHIKVGASR